MRCLLSTVLAALLTAGLASAPLAAQGADDAAASRLFTEARRLEQEGDAAAALREYQLVIQRFPSSRQAEEALLLVARAHRRAGDLVPARQAAEKLLADYPDSPNAAAALVLTADMMAGGPAALGDLEDARVTYRRVPLLFGRDRYPVLPWRSEARVRAGEVSLLLGDLEDAAASFVATIEDEAPSEWTARARLGLARVLVADGVWVAAADVLQRVVSTSAEPGNPEGDPEAAAAARRRLTLLHRLQVRPAAGQPRWQSARALQVAGTLLKKPEGVAASPEGSLLIADPGNDAVLLVDRSGSVEGRRPAKDPGHPWWTAGEGYAPAGSELLAVTERSTQSFVVPKGDKQEPLKDLFAGERGAFGQWYLVDGKLGVCAFTPTGAFLSVVASGEPADLAQDARGRLYVLDRKARAVSRFAANGTSEGVVLSGSWRKPEALAIDLLGNLYVLDRDEGTIHLFDPRGQKLSSVGPSLPGGLELRAPMDLAVDGSGRLYVADPRLGAVVVLE